MQVLGSPALKIMGCDIHLYIEYKRFKNSWELWNLERYLIQRNYELFSLMAKGVRGGNENSFEIKGLPEDISYNTFIENYLCISDNIKETGYINSITAEKWNKEYNCSYITKYNYKYISNPDWHSHSYLNPLEMNKVFNFLQGKYDNIRLDLRILETILLELSLEYGEKNVRVVFWFDN